MFQQHDRWVEELLEYTNREELITCTSGHMALTAIAAEIANACGDARVHDFQQRYDWQSMACDLADTLAWIGPELHGLVAVSGQAVHHAITNDLLETQPNGNLRLDDTKRPLVAAQIATLTGLLSGDDLLVAAWRDLVAACGDIDHRKYPHERIAFLRDTLIGLSAERKQDRRYWSPISIAVQVLLGNPRSVRQAQTMVGAIDTSTPFDPHAPISLGADELAGLAERCIVQPPPTGTFVVWFRFCPAFAKSDSCVTHDDVTFYEAQVLAGALTDHERARELFDVVPEELLTNEVREFQLSGKIDDYTGFEYDPQIVYARVTVRDVEPHHAVAAARIHLDAVLGVVEVHEKMWKILDGHLVFADTPSYLPPRWGLKEPTPESVFYENDYFTTHLREMAAEGDVITAEVARLSQPVLRLQAALKSVPRSDPEAIVMAAVRAIEHCNTWVAPLGGYRWYGFAEEYLFDEYTVTAFANRAVHDVFAAVVRYIPDHSPGAPVQPQLGEILKELTAPGWSLRINRQKTLNHVAELKQIYGGHWLARRLNETDDILSSTAALSAVFGTERDRLDARAKRLTRTRNAAIHGGPLSAAACDGVADFANTIGRRALNTVIRANVAGQPVDTYAARQRDEYCQRIQNLVQGGDLGEPVHSCPLALLRCRRGDLSWGPCSRPWMPLSHASIDPELVPAA
jgi:hypothetical protein